MDGCCAAARQTATSSAQLKVHHANLSAGRHMLRHHLSMEGKRSDPFFFNMTSECRS